MLACDFAEIITDGGQEVRVGGEYGAGGGKFDDGLGTVDRRDLSVDVDLAQPGFGNIRCELDDLDHLAGNIADRIIGGLQPDGLAAFAKALDLTGNAYEELLRVDAKQF